MQPFIVNMRDFQKTHRILPTPNLVIFKFINMIDISETEKNLYFKLYLEGWSQIHPLMSDLSSEMNIH